MVQTKRKLNNTELLLKLFLIQSKEIGKKSTTKEQQNLKICKARFRLNIDVRKEDSRLNAIKQLIKLVKGGLNFSCKSTTAAIVDLRVHCISFFDWLKNNHITVDKIYYLRSLYFFTNLFLNRRKAAENRI